MRAELGKCFASCQIQSPKQLRSTDLGEGWRGLRVLDPEERRHLPLQVKDKGFSKVPARPAARVTSAPFPPTHIVSWLYPEPTHGPIAAGADSSSRGCWRTKLLQRPSTCCALPTMQLPLVPWPDWTLEYPNMHPHPKRTALFSSARTLLAAPLHPQGLPVSSGRCSPVLGSLPGPRRVWGRCPGCA